MDVIGIGTPIMDMVINVDEMPERDGATGANEVFNQGGGKVASAMVAVARLGAQAGMCARVGSNRSGKFVLRDFEYNGVDTSRILVEEGASSTFCLSLSEECSRTRIFIGKSGTAVPLKPEDLDYAYLKTARCIHLESGNAASTAAASFAKENGILVSMDADHYAPEIEALTPKIDLLIASEFYYRALYPTLDVKTACEKIHAQGPKVAIITLGSQGCVGIAEGQGYFTLPAFDEVHVKDTTGAGDVFHGAFIVAYLQGRSAKESARFASAVSAIKCTYIGGRTGIPTMAMTESFLKDRTYDQAELEERLQHYRNDD